MPVVLSGAAEQDLIDICRYGAQEFGIAQADEYASELDRAMRLELVEHPMIGRARPELGPGLRTVFRGSHFIVYLLRDDNTMIIRVLHGRMDVKTALSKQESVVKRGR